MTTITEVRNSKYFNPACVAVAGAAMIAIAQRCQGHWAKQGMRIAGGTLLVGSAVAPFVLHEKVPEPTDICQILNLTFGEFVEKHRPLMREIPLERLATIASIKQLELEVDTELDLSAQHWNDNDNTMDRDLRLCALSVDLMIMRLWRQYRNEPDPKTAIAEHWGHQVKHESPRREYNGDYNIYFLLSQTYRVLRQYDDQADFFVEETKQYAWRELYNDWCKVAEPMLDKTCTTSGVLDGRYRNWSNQDTKYGEFSRSPDTQPS